MSQECIPGSAFPTWRSIINGIDFRSKIPVQFKNPPYLTLSGRDYLLQTYKDSQPSDDTVSKRRKTLEKLERCVKAKYGSRFEISLIGSIGHGLDLDSSDLDVCIVDTSNLRGGSYSTLRALNTPYDLHGLASSLRSAGFRVVNVITTADTPIINAVDPAASLPLDINVNAVSGIYKTLFLYHNARLSIIFLPLAFFIKTWAKTRQISSSTFHRSRNINSYALILILLTYLVQIKAVDNLFVRKEGSGWIDEALETDPPPWKRGSGTRQVWPIRFSTGRVDGKSPGVKKVDMMQTLLGFFAFLEDWETKTSSEMVSLKSGKRVSRVYSGSRAVLFVEDPFMTDRNSTGSLDATSARHFFTEAKRAKEILARGGSVQEVLGLIQPSGRGRDGARGRVTDLSTLLAGISLDR